MNKGKSLIQIAIIANLQNEMNIIAAGENWTSGVTNKGRTINWMRCINMEMIEFIDSFPWKHWKDINGKADIENAKMEIIDATHFLFSEAVVVFEHENLDWTSENSLLSDIIYRESQRYEKYSSNISSENSIAYQDAIEAGEDFCKLCTPFLGSDTDMTTPLLRTSRDIEYLFRALFKAAATVGLNWEDIYNLYLSKNALNIFRQKHGYANGTYLKDWIINGKTAEDNVWLNEIAKKLDSEDNLTFDTLILGLKTQYEKAVYTDNYNKQS